MELKAAALYLSQLKSGLKPGKKVDDADVADYLENVRRADESKFLDYLLTLPVPIRAQTFIELPTTLQVDLIEDLEAARLAEIANTLESDDATDLIRLIGTVDEAKKAAVFDALDDAHQQHIELLLGYNENEAGSLMQSELFRVCEEETVAESLKRLRDLKLRPGMGAIHYAFVTDAAGRLVRVVGLDDLILFDPAIRYADLPGSGHEPATAQSRESVANAVEKIQKYDLPVIAVVDKLGHLLGRITHDDAVDWVQKNATEQMYKLARVAPAEEFQGTLSNTARGRAFWLGVNLIGVTLVSVVVGLFEEVLGVAVALAILMPIISNMAGSASVQTITVAIRQMALGELRRETLMPFVWREVLISSGNGVIFGVLTAAIAQVRFEDWTVSAVMGTGMFLSLLFAGASGALVPIGFKKMGIDPATSSSVLIITLMDMLAFVFFLGLASWWLL